MEPEIRKESLYEYHAMLALLGCEPEISVEELGKSLDKPVQI